MATGLVFAVAARFEPVAQPTQQMRQARVAGRALARSVASRQTRVHEDEGGAVAAQRDLDRSTPRSKQDEFKRQ